MSWTKEDLIKAAFSELGLGAFYYDLEPEQVQDAAVKMEAMIAQWDLRLGYNASSNPNDIDVNAASGLADSANAAVYLNLSIRLARGYGKQVARELKVDATNALEDLMCKNLVIPSKEYDINTLSGAGNRTSLGDNSIFMPEAEEAIQTGNDGDLIFN